jgi:hypothetical protein
MRGKVMKEKTAKNVINNLYENRERISDNLTLTILEFCVTHSNTFSCKNLIKFVVELENTKDIISRFRIIDPIQIIARVDAEAFESFLFDSGRLDMIEPLLYTTKFVVERSDRDNVWYELYEEEQTKGDSIIVLSGILKDSREDRRVARGIVSNTIVDLYSCISQYNQILLNVVEENGMIRYYVK